MMWIRNTVITMVIAAGLMADRGLANIPVTVSVLPGKTTFRCDFTLDSGDTLGELTWQIVGASRPFFTYSPGGTPEVSIAAGFWDNITNIQSDGSTFHSIDFEISSDEAEEYLCHVQAQDSSEQGQAQTQLEVSNLPPKTVYAFSAYQSVDARIDDTPFIFDTVLTDTHGMYSPFSGIFIPPVQGYYFLTASLVSIGTSYFSMNIRRNDQVLCRSHSEIRGFYPGVCSAVVELFPGDQVRVTANDGQVGTLHGLGLSGFSGYMVSGV